MVAAAVILDLDGTVWNSRRWYAETIARLSGDSVLQVELKLDAGISVVRVASEHGARKSQMIKAARENGSAIELYDRVIPTLGELRGRGTPIGVVTNLPGWLAQPMLKSTGIGEYVAAIATPRAGIPAKPKPHGIRSVLNEIELVAGAQAWFVGDGSADAEAAKAASVCFAWASFGYESEEPHDTDKVLVGFDELLAL